MDPTSDALAGLRDIHMPDPIAFWPLAPGWWWLGLALVAAALTFQFIRYRLRLSARRAALQELRRLEQDYSETRDTSALACGLSALLRRVALVRGERNQVATLHGKERAQFLCAGSQRFSPALLEGIEAALYANPSEPAHLEDAQAWLDAVRGFIRRTA